MSFNFEFTAATGEEAQKIVAQENAPECVKQFLTMALSAFPSKMCYVKANGHLFNNDYQTSTATLVVQEVVTRKPKET